MDSVFIMKVMYASVLKGFYEYISRLKPGPSCTPTLAHTHFLVATEELWWRRIKCFPYDGAVTLPFLGSQQW